MWYSFRKFPESAHGGASACLKTEGQIGIEVHVANVVGRGIFCIGSWLLPIIELSA